MTNSRATKAGRTAIAVLTVLMAGGMFTQHAEAQAVNAEYLPNVTTSAGNGTSGYAGDTGPASASTVKFSKPASVTYDAAGNLYVCDTGNNVIRRIDAVTGIITTVAGTGTASFSGDGGPATSATLDAPEQVAFDAAGNMYIADGLNDRIREVNAQTGVITTVIGNGTTTTKAGVAGTATGIDTADSVQIDAAGDIIFASTSQDSVWALSATTGLTYKFAGTGTGSGASGDGGPATSAVLVGPRSMIEDPFGNMYLVDRYNSVIREVAYPSGIISTVAGKTLTTGGTGNGGPAVDALLNTPQGAATDALGNLYIADTGNNRFRVINAQTGVITNFAGNGTSGYTGDGSVAVSAEFKAGQGIAVSPDGSQYSIADTGNNVIRQVAFPNIFPQTEVASSSAAQKIFAEATVAGTISAFQIAAGMPSDFAGSTPTGCPGAIAANALCHLSVTFTPTAPGLRNSSLVLTDSANDQYILGISGVGLSPAASFFPGTISSFAGTGIAGSTGDGSAASAATVNAPAGVALDAAGNVYIADTASNKVRVVNSATGTISTFAGTGTAGSSGDGGAASAAELNAPNGIALDSAGDLFIADTANNRIREVSAATGTISTFAGSGMAGATGDGGAAVAAALNAPYGVASDQKGDLYIADSGNNEIREVNAFTGIIKTIAGTGAVGDTGNNVPASTATLAHPQGVALDASGNLYIADTGNNQVREISNGTIVTIAGTGSAGATGDGGPAVAATLNAPTAIYVDPAGDVYIADTGNNRIREITAQTGIISTVSGDGTSGSSGNGGPATSAELAAPSSIVGDPFGNLYIADTANNRIADVDVVDASLDFGSVNDTTTSSAQTISLMNFGNQTLQLSSVVFSSSMYQQLSGAADDCTASTSLVPGAACQIRVVFSPTSTGSSSYKVPVPATITITDNALNNTASTQTVNLTGIAVLAGQPAAITPVAGAGQTEPPLGPYPTQLQALVTDINGNPVNNVSVTFTAPASGSSGTFANGTTTVTVLTDATGIATASLFTANGLDGNFVVDANVSGVAAPAVFPESIVGNVSPVLMLNTGTTSLQYGQSLSATVTLTPSTVGSITATGTVNLIDAGTVVASAPVVSGVATFNYAPNAGEHTLTASYSGDSNFSASTTLSSTSVDVTPLSIVLSASSVTIPYGTAIPVIQGTITGALSKDLNNLVATFTASTSAQFPDVGQYALTATLTGSAATNYVFVVSGTPTLNIVQASSLTTLSVTNAQPSLGSSVTLSATVSSSVSGAPPPSGTVTFYSGTASIGSATLVAGAASLVTTSLPAGSQSITAVYQGSLDYSASTSAPFAVNVIVPNFAFALSAGSAAVQQGERTYVTVTATGNQAFSGTINLSCSGLPANASCTFVPAVIQSSGSSLLTVATAGPTVATRDTLGPRRNNTFLALFVPVMLIGFGRRRLRGGHAKRVSLLFLCAAVLASIGFLSGCGGATTSINTVKSTTGTTSITVVAQSGTIVQSATFSLTVTAAQ